MQFSRCSYLPPEGVIFFALCSEVKIFRLQGENSYPRQAVRILSTIGGLDPRVPGSVLLYSTVKLALSSKSFPRLGPKSVRPTRTANLFCSWSWRYSLETVVGGLSEWAHGRDPSGVYAWICAFCNNQYRILEEGSQQGSDDLGPLLIDLDSDPAGCRACFLVISVRSKRDETSAAMVCICIISLSSGCVSVKVSSLALISLAVVQHTTGVA